MPLLLVALAALAVAPQGRPAPDTTTIVIAATTDVHGRVLDWDYERDRAAPLGLVRAATVVDSLRRVHPGRVVLLDVGDLIQGNPFATYFAKVAPRAEHPILEAMNRMGYDAAVPGNHEFNFGLPVMQRSLGTARFPYVAANLRRVDGSAVLPPFVLLERSGVRIAVVGLTQPGTMVWDAANVQGRVTIQGMAAALSPAVREARSSGADLVVLLAHAGLAGGGGYDATAAPPENEVGAALAAAPAVDVTILGHTHRDVVDTTVAGSIVTQPRQWAQSVAVVTVDLVREGRAWRVARKRSALVPLQNVRPDSALGAAMRPYHDAVRTWAAAPLGRSAAAMSGERARLEDVPVTDFVAEVMRARSGAQLAATAAFTTRSGLPAGPVSRADIAGVYPYDNTLMAVRISGADLRAFLEHSSRYYRGMGPAGPVVDTTVPGYNFDLVSGAEYELDLARPPGQRVVQLRFGGHEVAPTDSFTLAVNNYRRQGGGGFVMLPGAPTVYDRGEDIRELLAEEIQRRGTIRPEDYFTRNWSLRGVPAAVPN